ncbi:MAG: glycosyltransferase family 4 protein [Nannocystaceae bacterium]
MVRVLFVSHTFPPADKPLANIGGMQRVAVDLSRYLAELPDIDLRLWACRGRGALAAVHTVQLELALLARLPERVRRERIDVVLFSSVTSIFPLGFNGRRVRASGASVAAIAHGLDVTADNVAYQWLLRRALGHVDRLFPVSRATGRTLVHLGVPQSKVHVLPNGIDLDRFGTDKAAPEHLTRHEAPPSAPVLVSVGRLVERKGFAWFVDYVMPKLPDNTQYWVVGEGPARPSISAAVERRGLSDRVQLLGRVSEAALAEVYRRGDLFVMPNVPVANDMEGFGVVMLEAGLSGLFSVASDLEGIADVICQDQNGQLVPARDADAFAQAITEILADREALAQRSRTAAAYVREKFAWDRVAREYARELHALSDLRTR